MRLRVVPVSLALANSIVAGWHRHHPPTTGHRFSLAVMNGAQVAGVAIIGRPVARMLDQERLVEVLRCCTDGSRNACSALYGAAARTAQAMGFYAVLTYTLEHEGGASLRAAGWWGEDVEASDRVWNAPSRPRSGGIAETKRRWVRLLSEYPQHMPTPVYIQNEQQQQDMFPAGG